MTKRSRLEGKKHEGEIREVDPSIVDDVLLVPRAPTTRQFCDTAPDQLLMVSLEGTASPAVRPRRTGAVG